MLSRSTKDFGHCWKGIIVGISEWGSWSRDICHCLFSIQTSKEKQRRVINRGLKVNNVFVKANTLAFNRSSNPLFMTLSSLNDIYFMHNKKLARSCKQSTDFSSNDTQKALNFGNRLATPVSYRTLMITISWLLKMYFM